MICPSCNTVFNGAKGACFSCGSEIEKSDPVKKVEDKIVTTIGKVATKKK